MGYLLLSGLSKDVWIIENLFDYVNLMDSLQMIDVMDYIPFRFTPLHDPK